MQVQGVPTHSAAHVAVQTHDKGLFRHSVQRAVHPVHLVAHRTLVHLNATAPGAHGPCMHSRPYVDVEAGKQAGLSGVAQSQGLASRS